MSFLKIGDRAAGAIKSGGTTRRAAKMVCLDIDHPEIEEFINWKVKEEKKVAALIAAGYDSHFEGEAYTTVSGQNSNNSVRVPHTFMRMIDANGDWNLIRRIDGKPYKTVKSQDMWQKVCYAAWACADPGVQYDDTINEWHTCPQSGRIRASNPCVTGDTLVLTEEGKWKRIDSFVDEETTILTNTGNIIPSSVKGSFVTGVKPVYKITTRCGYELKLTADHKVFTVNRGFIAAAELTKDDKVLLPDIAVAEIKEPEDPVYYQMIGVYLGDGCGTSDHGIQFTMEKEREAPILEKFASYVEETYERKTHKTSPATMTIRQTSNAYVITNSVLKEKVGML